MGIVIFRCAPLILDRACSLSLIVSIQGFFPVSYTIILLLFAGDCAVMDRIVGDILPSLIVILPSVVLLLSLVVGSTNSMVYRSLIFDVLSSTVIAKVYLPDSSN